MTDAHLRTTQRKAALGDPQAQVALLRRRMRAREVTRAGVELAAYLGHGVALEALGWSAGRNGRVYFENESGATVSLADANMLDVLGHEAWSQWISGISSQPRPVLVRCAFAAAVRALEACQDCGGFGLVQRKGLWDAPCHRCLAPRRALEAAARWIFNPSEANREACETINELLVPEWAGLVVYSIAVDEVPPYGSLTDAIKAAARLTDEPTIRAALLSDVAPWALGERDAVEEWLKPGA